MDTKYTIKIENFEGPFDLLFHLIEKNKIDIYDIPIALITEQYLEYLEAMQEMDLDIASEFLIMAATLLHIKSKMLLPKNKESLNEADDQEDPRDELVARLLEYKKYKEFTVELKEREMIQNLVYYKLPDIIEMDKTVQQQLVGLNPEDLIFAFKRVLERNTDERLHNNAAFSQILNREKVSVAKKVRDVLKVLKHNEVVRFTELFCESSSKMEKIAIFLAVLELIKLKRVVIEQNDNFGDIVIYKNKNATDSI